MNPEAKTITERKLVKNGGLAKTLNSLRTVPGATNPFVAAQNEKAKAKCPECGYEFSPPKRDWATSGVK